MKRIIATLSFVAASVILLAGCASVSGSSGTQPVDLTNPSVIASLCGADAASVQATVASAAKANPNSGQRHTLVNWGITDPTNDKAIASILSTLNKRAAVKDCKTDAKTASDTKATYTKAELKAIADSLTISTTPASAECKTDANGLVSPEIDSLLGVPPRLWPDAISTPFTSSDPVAARAELQAAICKDPNLGVAWLTFMATSVRDKLLAATGIDLLVLNPRLKAYTDVSQITPKATAFVPLLNVKMQDRTSKLIKSAMDQNVTWQQDAALVNTLLERYAVLGIDSRESIVNYKLTDYGQDAGAIPVIGINSEEPDSRAAQIYALTSKTKCGEIIAFGANVGDKRPELFEAKDCAPPTTTTTPGCTVNCGSSTHKCTSNCGSTPPVCTINCSTNPCPPGNMIPACAPKSHNPSDYTYPSGKPKATVTTPPDATPPPVVTTQPGGGGVTDTPTNQPGSETGTTSPGATTPSTAPATPPVNQGGDNGAGDTGGF